MRNLSALLLALLLTVSSAAFAQQAKTIALSQERDPECIHVRIDAGWATIEVSVKRLRGIRGADENRAKRLIGLYDSTANKSGCVLLFNIWNVAAVAESGFLVGDLIERGEAVVFVDIDRPEKEIVMREMAYPDSKMKLFSLKDGRGFYGYQTGVR